MLAPAHRHGVGRNGSGENAGEFRQLMEISTFQLFPRRFLSQQWVTTAAITEHPRSHLG
jgi:hypothetical protein